MLTPALANQTAHWLRHLPPGIDLFQKYSTGRQEKMALKTVQHDQAKMKVMRLKFRMRNRRYGKIRKYCNRIENLHRNRPRLYMTIEAQKGFRDVTSS